MKCSNCLHFFKKHKKKPLCQTAKGCPVQDCAEDPRIEAVIESFLKAKSLAQFPYALELQKKILQEANLLEDENLLYQLEQIYLRYLIIEAQKRT